MLEKDDLENLLNKFHNLNIPESKETNKAMFTAASRFYTVFKASASRRAYLFFYRWRNIILQYKIALSLRERKVEDERHMSQLSLLAGIMYPLEVL